MGFIHVAGDLARARVRNVDYLSWSLWYGSGGTRGQRGVGFLLHNKWTDYVSIYKPMSDRLAFLDVAISKKLTVRCFSVYMPHSEYPDQDVEVVYTMLDDAILLVGSVAMQVFWAVTSMPR